MTDTAFAIWTALAAAIFAALAMAASHYLTTVIMGREVGPPGTYVIGCGAGILLPFAVWVAFYAAAVDALIGVWLPLVALVMVIAGAGVGTVGAYLADWWHGYRSRQRQP